MLAGIAFTVFFVTDTSAPKQSALEDLTSTETRASPNSLKNQADELLSWMRANRSVVLLLASFFVVQLGRQISNILIQYVSIKFSWSLSQVRQPVEKTMRRVQD